MIYPPGRFSVSLGFGGEVTTYLQRPRTTTPPQGPVSTGARSWQLMMKDPKRLGLVTQASQTLETGLKRKRAFFLICMRSPPRAALYLSLTSVGVLRSWFSRCPLQLGLLTCGIRKKKKNKQQLNGNKPSPL